MGPRKPVPRPDALVQRLGKSDRERELAEWLRDYGHRGPLTGRGLRVLRHCDGAPGKIRSQQLEPQARANRLNLPGTDVPEGTARPGRFETVGPKPDVAFV